MMLAFTYGTLMKGQCREHVMDNCRYIGDAILNGYGLLELGNYPGAVPMDGYRVFGEVYEIDEDKKIELDEIEGEGYLYAYREADVDMDGKLIKAGFYEYLLDNGTYQTMEPTGKWRKH